MSLITDNWGDTEAWKVWLDQQVQIFPVFGGRTFVGKIVNTGPVGLIVRTEGDGLSWNLRYDQIGAIASDPTAKHW